MAETGKHGKYDPGEIGIAAYENVQRTGNDPGFGKNGCGSPCAWTGGEFSL